MYKYYNSAPKIEVNAVYVAGNTELSNGAIVQGEFVFTEPLLPDLNP
jgi:hypothetical protein